MFLPPLALDHTFGHQFASRLAIFGSGAVPQPLLPDFRVTGKTGKYVLKLLLAQTLH